MARVVIRHIDEAPLVDFPASSRISYWGHVATRAVIHREHRPILLLKHEMAPGSKVEFNRPVFDHGIYVLGGTIEIDGESVEQDRFLTVEHLARSSISAGDDGAILLDYHRPDHYAREPARAGGRVHISKKGGIIRAAHPAHGHVGTLWADSDCPNCEVWMHKSEFAQPKPQGRSHSHSADEIIYVLAGEMLVGNRSLRPGTALAIDANTLYGFGVGEPGLVFLNFRPEHSFSEQAGEESKPPTDELQQWRTAVIA